MSSHRNDSFQDFFWRLKSLPQRLRGEIPGASKAEALEDLLLLGTLVVGSLIFVVFVASTFSGSSSSSYAAAPRDAGPAYVSSSSGPKDLRPVKGFGYGSSTSDPARAAGGGGGGRSGGGGGGGGAGAAVQPVCDPELPETVRNRAGFRMFSFWRDRDDPQNCRTQDLQPQGPVR